MLWHVTRGRGHVANVMCRSPRAINGVELGRVIAVVPLTMIRVHALSIGSYEGLFALEICAGEAAAASDFGVVGVSSTKFRKVGHAGARGPNGPARRAFRVGAVEVARLDRIPRRSAAVVMGRNLEGNLAAGACAWS